jgi:ADP-ribose pyrophosphatase YjhB (NUDIX family)
MDIGETLAEAAIREVKEETGFDVRIERIIGIYSDPGHVFAYDNGEIRREFSICLACTIIGGSLSVSSESTAVKFFAHEDISGIQIHESILVRIRDYLNGGPPALR